MEYEYSHMAETAGYDVSGLGPGSLIQEALERGPVGSDAEYPLRVLVGTTLCCMTSRPSSHRAMWRLMISAAPGSLATLIIDRPKTVRWAVERCGLVGWRTAAIERYARAYAAGSLDEAVTGLYTRESYDIFVAGRVNFIPTDRELIRYLGRST